MIDRRQQAARIMLFVIAPCHLIGTFMFLWKRRRNLLCCKDEGDTSFDPVKEESEGEEVRSKPEEIREYPVVYNAPIYDNTERPFQPPISEDYSQTKPAYWQNNSDERTRDYVALDTDTSSSDRLRLGRTCRCPIATDKFIGCRPTIGMLFMATWFGASVFLLVWASVPGIVPGTLGQ